MGSEIVKSFLDNSKKCVYYTTYEVLKGLSKLIAPITPFISEEIYRNLTNEESVHLAKCPTYNENLMSEDIAKRMDLVRNLISLGRNVREEEKIKVRQPISEVILDGKNKEILKGLEELIKEELNVKNIIFENDLTKYMNLSVKPNFKEAGKILGNKMKDFVKFLSNLSEEEIENIQKGKTLSFEGIEITNNLIEVKISSKEGMSVAMEDKNFIILNTTLTEELIKEGIAREVVSKVQNLRKEKDFDIENRIKLYYNSNDYFDEVLQKFGEYIKDETLALEIIKDDTLTKKYNINDIEVYLDVERIEK